MNWLRRIDGRELVRYLLHIVPVYIGASVAGWVAMRLNVPLPWMIGSLVFTLALGVTFGKIRVPGFTRPIGQVIVAGSVGLAFTPAALAAMISLLWAMVALAGLTVVAGLITAWVLMKLARIDVVTATLASIPMGPVESANIGRRYNIPLGPVVFSQTMRIVTLVLLIPPGIIALDGTVTDPNAALREQYWEASGAALLLFVSVLGAAAMAQLKVSNPYFLGPLAGSAIAAALMLPVTAVPYPVLAIAQLFLGVWPGAVFDREFFRKAGSFLPAAVASTAVMVTLCALLGIGAAAVLGESWSTMVLASAPGSVTEMALTAKLLQEGVAVVTAFHIVRIFLIIPFAAHIIRAVARLSGRDLENP